MKEFNQMDILTFFLGILVGYFIEKILDSLIARVKLSTKKRKWKKAEQIWEKYQSLSFGLIVIQAGWKAGEFSEEQVVVTIDNSYKIPKDIAENLYNSHKGKWESADLNDNEQYGIAEIDPHRVSDEITTKSDSHQLRIKGHTYRYFEFLATNRLFRSGTKEEQEFLNEIIGKPHYLEPVSSFPNPLSVGLSLFCENGNSLVLTRRTIIASSGGLWAGNTIFNAVGENMIPYDTYGNNFQGSTRLSPWITAKRGLHEEMGIVFSDKTMSMVLHSFVWDSRILDYKFFGYVINSFSRADIRKAWINAPDRNENSELIFFDCSTDKQVVELVEELIHNKSKWASECILCTVLSLFHLDKITPLKIEKIINES